MTRHVAGAARGDPFSRAPRRSERNTYYITTGAARWRDAEQIDCDALPMFAYKIFSSVIERDGGPDETTKRIVERVLFLSAKPNTHAAVATDYHTLYYGTHKLYRENNFFSTFLSANWDSIEWNGASRRDSRETGERCVKLWVGMWTTHANSWRCTVREWANITISVFSERFMLKARRHFNWIYFFPF